MTIYQEEMQRKAQHYLSLFPLVDQHHLMTNGKAIYENPSLIDLLKQNGYNFF